MKMRHFLRDDTGSATIEWLVLTASAIGMSLATLAVVSGGVESLSQDSAVELAALDADENFFVGLADAALNLATYEPLALAHMRANRWPDRQGRTWAEKTHARWSGFSDTRLWNMYGRYYTSAVRGLSDSQYHRRRADYVAIIEDIFRIRDIATPEENLSAAEIRALYDA